MLHAVNDAVCDCPTWRLDEGIGITGKTTVTVFEVSSGVMGGRHRRPLTSQVPAYVCAVGHLNFSSIVELFMRPLSQSHRCGTDLVSLYCIWWWPPPWPHLFILVTLAELSMVAWQATTDFHTQGGQASCRSVVSLVSDLHLP